MPVTTLSSRKFSQEVSSAKKRSEQGPVIITDRGTPTHVLLSFHEYRKLTDKRPNIVDLLAMPEAAEIEFEIPPRCIYEARPLDLD